MLRRRSVHITGWVYLGTMPISPFFANYTISMFLKFLSANTRLFCSGYSGNRGPFACLSNGLLRFSHTHASYSPYAEAKVQLGVWHHVVIVSTLTQELLYLDGCLVGICNSVPSGNEQYPWYTGTWGSYTIAGMPGSTDFYIGELLLFNKSFSKEEVYTLFRGLNFYKEHCVAEYLFTENNAAWRDTVRNIPAGFAGYSAEYFERFSQKPRLVIIGNNKIIKE